jgi:hypothetical protein
MAPPLPGGGWVGEPKFFIERGKLGQLIRASWLGDDIARLGDDIDTGNLSSDCNAIQRCHWAVYDLLPHFAIARLRGRPCCRPSLGTKTTP